MDRILLVVTDKYNKHDGEAPSSISIENLPLLSGEFDDFLRIIQTDGGNL